MFFFVEKKFVHLRFLDQFWTKLKNTAAHCLIGKSRNTPKKPQDLIYINVLKT